MYKCSTFCRGFVKELLYYLFLCSNRLAYNLQLFWLAQASSAEGSTNQSDGQAPFI